MDASRAGQLCIVTAAISLAACSHATDASVSKLFDAHRSYAESQIDWINADIALLRSGCSGIHSVNRKVLDEQYSHWQSAVAANPADENIANQARSRAPIDALKERLTLCDSIDARTPEIAGIRSHLAGITDSRGFPLVQRQLVDLRSSFAAQIAAFPTEVLRESNFVDTAILDYKAAHQAALQTAGEAVADVVDGARDASGNATSITTLTSTHQTDKELATESESAYTAARVGLGQIGNARTPDDTFLAIDEVFGNAEQAIAFAEEATSGKSANPVGDVAEAVPQASFEPMNATPVPVIETRKSATVNVSNPDSDIGSNSTDASVVSVLRSTHGINLTEGATQDCGASDPLIRFADDGTSGCAVVRSAVRGTVNGVTILLVPLEKADHGVTSDLLYSDRNGKEAFLGLLPGDGTGNLSVTIEDGLIVERNGENVKKSTFVEGKLTSI